MIRPNNAGIRTFIKKRNIEALNPTDANSPNCWMKKTEAPSLIPSSPKLIGGTTVFENMIRFPVQI